MRLVMRRWLAIMFVTLLAWHAPLRAADAPLFTVDQLDQMLAPIALFPDPLLSQILMASTYPEDVAEAADWALANRTLEGDAAVRAVQSRDWDPSVQSLVAFPQVMAMMGDNPEWVMDVGDAFLSDPVGVMDSIQFLRARAQSEGNLSSNEHQVIKVEAAPPRTETVVVSTHRPPTQVIVIEPANPQVIFVPAYNPNLVFGSWWNPWAPPMFFTPAPYWGFTQSVVGSAIWWGVGIGVTHALWGNMNWRNNSVNINVNHWNNINVNNRISSNNRDINWRHDSRHRRDLPPRDAATRERLRNAAADRSNRVQRDGNRVSNDRRNQARDVLSNRVGSESLTRDALRNVDRNQVQNRLANVDRNQARERAANLDRSQVQNRAANIDRDQARQRAANVNRDQVRERAANVDRSQVQSRAANIDRDQARQRAANLDRSQVQNRAANVNRAQVQNRAAAVDRDQARQRAANVDRNQVQNRAAAVNRNQAQSRANANVRPQTRQEQAARINRDSAMRGVGNNDQARRQIDRGAASQRIANNPQAAQRIANNPQAAQRAAERRARQ